jgi:hypothetical protein
MVFDVSKVSGISEYTEKAEKERRGEAEGSSVFSQSC